MGAVRALLDLVFPPKCVFCSRLLRATEEAICDTCRNTLPECHKIRTFPFVAACRSPLYYEDQVREAILRYKFQDASHYSRVFGQLVGQLVAAWPEAQPEVLTWVPVSRKRLRSRGYDQAKLLAEATGAVLGLPVTATLRKVRDNPPQSGLQDAAGRRANVLNVYEAVDPASFAGKRVLLIDDVATTGSTLSECARVLVTAGAGEVLAATLAMGREDRKAAEKAADTR
jgi:ComF family protein